jgi:hypothetical protein
MNITGDNTGTLKNNAAVGTSVTAMGSGASAATVGRIYGGITTQVTPSANYARETMFLGTGAHTYNPYPVLTPVTATDNAADRDGSNRTSAQFTSTVTTSSGSWLSASMLDFNNADHTGIWDFSSISRGYPKLANVGGQ